MITMKHIGLIVFLVFLSACASEPANKSYVGTGQFDQTEAAKTRVSLGLTYLKNGNFSQAKFNLDKALEFDPRSGQANFAMAFYYQQVEEFERAEEYYQQAIGYSRNDPDVLNSYGAFLCKQGKYNKAKTYFLQAVDDKSYISTAETYENLAICMQSQGNDVEAIEYFNSALNHQPSRASSLLYISELYVKQQNWDEAKKALWKYERNATVSAESLYLSYQIAQGQGDLRASLEYVDLLKRLHPNHGNTKQALAELGKFKPQSTITQKARPQTTRPQTAPPTITQPATTVVTEPAEADTVVNASVTTTPSIEDIDSPTAQDITEDTEKVVDVVEPETSVDSPMGLSDDETGNKIDDKIDEKVLSIEVPDGYHLVLPKENLYRISLQYNVKMNKLLLWNQLDDASSIQKGSLLRVKAPEQDE
ncbi:type IV pilus biogenesis/stability protein PilW [Glaciecola petra]|uniref:Type IV pilus biogenesis/stability protein PilW n=1 Tax=Glaciecola petra TaxID=3075602 RepID=A0ABU2ZU66_9ALTE|nr:type IV pilus biogenesis/stability protein PilW [Aestuariibacter sp. P117]MDT0595869.1 type IV pilus biogenesis/stability protein PilW [Aestuariibacter sp. P117]